MVILVREGKHMEHWIDVPYDDRDLARKIAFRFIHKRRERDYQEIVETTRALDVIPIAPQAAEILRSHF